MHGVERRSDPVTGSSLCAICGWPVEVYHAPAKRDGELVHAQCLDVRKPPAKVEREAPKKAANQ